MTEMIVAAVFALLVGLMVFAAYRQGLKDGRQVENKQELKPLFKLPETKSQTATTELDELLKWADDYQG